MKKKLILGFMLLLFLIPSVVNAQDAYAFDFGIAPASTQSTAIFHASQYDNISVYVTVVGAVEVTIDDALTQDIFAWEDLANGTYLVNYTFGMSGNFYIDFYNLQLDTMSFVNGSYFLNMNVTDITNITATQTTTWTTPTDWTGTTYPTDWTGPTATTYYDAEDTFWLFGLRVPISLVFGIGIGVFVTVFCTCCRSYYQEEDFSYLDRMGEEEMFPPGTMREEENNTEEE